MSDALIQIVDENDNPIGGATKQDIWAKGLLHRIVRMMVEDERGNVLIQLRSLSKPNYPGCWDNSAAGHVDEGENYLQAAQREMKEEIGIEAKLELVKSYSTRLVFRGLKLNRFNRLYRAVIPHSTKFHIQKEELDRVRWVSKVELKSLIENNPDEVADGLLEAYEIMYKP